MKATQQEILQKVEKAKGHLALVSGALSPSLPGAEPNAEFINDHLEQAQIACIEAAQEHKLKTL